MALDNFRRIVRRIDFANDYFQPVQLSAGDHDGRIIRVIITDGGANVTNGSRLSAMLVWNYSPDTSLGGFVIMNNISTATECAFEVAVPTEMTEHRCGLGAVIVRDGDTMLCTRVFQVSSDAALISADSPEAQDRYDELVRALSDAASALRDLEVHGDVITDPTGQDIARAIREGNADVTALMTKVNTLNGAGGIANGGTGASTVAGTLANFGLAGSVVSHDTSDLWEYWKFSSGLCVLSYGGLPVEMTTAMAGEFTTSAAINTAPPFRCHAAAVGALAEGLSTVHATGGIWGNRSTFRPFISYSEPSVYIRIFFVGKEV